MKADDIKALGRKAFKQLMEPTDAPRMKKSFAILGFDTEYDSKTHELLSVQLSCEGRECYYTTMPGEKLSWPLLARLCAEVAPIDVDEWFLCCYWSKAELSTFEESWWENATVRRVHGAEVYNARHVPEEGPAINVIDVWHFFFPKSLKNIAPHFGEAKLEWDTTKVSRSMLRRKGFREYAMNDAHITERIFTKLRDIGLKEGVDILRSKTPASAGMALYRSQYLTRKVTIPRYQVRRYAMVANQGGIGEAYMHAKEAPAPEGDAWVQNDAVSLYPTAVLALGALPMKEHWRYKRGRPDDGMEGFARAAFNFPPDTQYPCVPEQTKHGTIYPLSGVVVTTLAELREAERAGATVQYLHAWYYDPKEADDSFPRFVRAYFAKRKTALDKGDSAGAIFYKNVLNSSIGKLSEHHRGLDLEAAKKLAKEKGLPLSVYLQVKDDAQKVCEPGFSWVPEWHALILGKARAIMQNAIREGRSRVTSTDSLIHLRSEALKAGLPGVPDETRSVRTPEGVVTFKCEAQASWLSVVRQRLYLLGEEKAAHHAVHLRAEAARKILHETPLGASREYTTRKTGTLRDSILGKRAFGHDYEREMKYNAHWGLKRRLLADGTTEPWRQAADFLEAWACR